jgi:hypothetical protein
VWKFTRMRFCWAKNEVRSAKSHWTVLIWGHGYENSILLGQNHHFPLTTFIKPTVGSPTVSMRSWQHEN